ncbi:hypothetical protein E4K67_22310 [Desulfosporosinus fructosivorans]|uniref:Uncharacterized protein n=1 Tax=Desulfosporosinus fructosivorans TaxID=2018669 RepID=A0A4Z0QZH1_9FIRM|nr:hypothetical protein [Desulfosporosinus fructosivorans]TGE35854.1 hypothetical protein E4K67_22310 [Desulfosporosinus fructosivorans]
MFGYINGTAALARNRSQEFDLTEDYSKVISSKEDYSTALITKLKFEQIADILGDHASSLYLQPLDDSYNNGTIIHLTGIEGLSQSIQPSLHLISNTNNTNILKKENQQLQLLVSKYQMEAYDLTQKLSTAMSLNGSITAELAEKGEMIMEITNSKPFSTIMGIGIMCIIIGFISALTTKMLGIGLFLVGFVALFFGTYCMWKFKNITIINPNTSILGMFGSVFLLITMIFGFVVY